DMLAEAATWSRRNARTLVDTHWIGGDPKKLEVYGWASWSPTRGIVTLRNPSDKAQRFALDVASAFELPPDAPRRYASRSPWSRYRARAAVQLRAGAEHAVQLAPFQSVTLAAAPAYTPPCTLDWITVVVRIVTPVVRGFRGLYLGLFFNCMIMATVNLAGVKIANVMLGWPMGRTLAVCTVLNVAFAATSGLWGVMVTDMIQFGIAMTGSFAAAYFALQQPQVGGLAGLFH